MREQAAGNMRTVTPLLRRPAAPARAQLAFTSWLALGCLTACLADPAADGAEGDAPPPEFPEAPSLLSNLAENVVLTPYRQFDMESANLQIATASYQLSLSVEDLETARAAWRTTMSVWQRAEVYQAGPAGASGHVKGGLDLRDEIYSWPLSNSCRVDQETLESAFADPASLALETINVRGLDAIEYLLFNETIEHTCPAGLTLDTTWPGRLSEIPQLRADYAAALTVEVAATATTLLAAWETSSGAFVDELRLAGRGSIVYPTTHSALNAVSDALFYLDTFAKDLKRAIPAGISDCTSGSCPEQLESLWATHSKENIVANLGGAQALFLGAPVGEDGYGFDDLLVSLDETELSETMSADLAETVAAANAIEEVTLKEALSVDQDSVVALHDALKDFTTNLKTQFVAVMELQLPQRAEGDND